MRKFFHENGLSSVFFFLSLICIVGQALTGHQANNDELIAHGRPAISMSSYLKDGHFGESVFENWESEFLQMGLFVFLAVFLKQKGSSE
jgi:hypothetical protein